MTHDSAVCGGLADGASSIGSEGGKGHFGSDHRSRTTRRTTRNAGVVMGIDGVGKSGVFGGGAHREFVHVGAPYQDGARPHEACG